MSIRNTAQSLSTKLRLGSHYGVERLGVLVGMFAVAGALIFAATGFSAVRSAQAELTDTALYTPSFTTSKTQLKGAVDGVYTSTDKSSVLVLMHFDPDAHISHDASDYRAFLLGSTPSLHNEQVKTSAVSGDFYVFGSTGYVGAVMRAGEPFASQVLNLTMRSDAELTVAEQAASKSTNPAQAAGDSSFAKYDQWQVFFNPAAGKAAHISALDRASFNPALAYYETVIKPQEDAARQNLDNQLAAMRADLAQITAYNNDLATTKVGGLSLRVPQVPAIVAGDAVSGHSAAEAPDGASTLALSTATTVAGGIKLDWRAGNVYDGYLSGLVPAGQTYVGYLAAKNKESGTQFSSTDLKWKLSDGTDLTQTTSGSSSTLRPLVTVMNNLSGAYQSYWTDKQKYQKDLAFALLGLEVDVHDARDNTSANTAATFMTVYE